LHLTEAAKARNAVSATSGRGPEHDLEHQVRGYDAWSLKHNDSSSNTR